MFKKNGLVTERGAQTGTETDECEVPPTILPTRFPFLFSRRGSVQLTRQF